MRVSIVILLCFVFGFLQVPVCFVNPRTNEFLHRRSGEPHTIQRQRRHRRGCDEPWRNRGGFHISSGLWVPKPEQEPP